VLTSKNSLPICADGINLLLPLEGFCPNFINMGPDRALSSKALYAVGLGLYQPTLIGTHRDAGWY
jgi:hypothetical protein